MRPSLYGGIRHEERSRYNISWVLTILWSTRRVRAVVRLRLINEREPSSAHEGWLLPFLFVMYIQQSPLLRRYVAHLDIDGLHSSTTTAVQQYQQ